jgi:uncharacterized protein YecT (DUF1311 family)
LYSSDVIGFDICKCVEISDQSGISVCYDQYNELPNKRMEYIYNKILEVYKDEEEFVKLMQKSQNSWEESIYDYMQLIRHKLGSASSIHLKKRYNSLLQKRFDFLKSYLIGQEYCEECIVDCTKGQKYTPNEIKNILGVENYRKIRDLKLLPKHRAYYEDRDCLIIDDGKCNNCSD